jgi:hypothetical protein
MPFHSRLFAELVVVVALTGTAFTARADGGSIRFSGAIVSPSSPTASLVTGSDGGDIRAMSRPNQQVVVQPLRAEAAQHIALLDYFAQRTAPGKGRLVTATYD